ncbi:YbhB/YbcL family Raf kinase inhibitor-like protein [Massilia arenosa]|uniref:YbhB/YbcL family Raf kinase inhibitor-like protein n=1 Tax=Zemynaea arenosa TaxID=2561931 RepID=A0A4Y9S4R8_9BURK|nr:YbhB/YbcL family Raf kinase inhibitor-like protein [Massilia arenosa]TFW16180.1 YbhB/YbcL family Raf kinase inhibitor-like protein [Massilia arenosa]
MKLWSDSFRDGGLLPPENAFAVIDPDTHVRFSDNRNPHLAWDDVPAGTESLVLFCIDVDVPSVGNDVNRVGHSVAEDLPRTEFFHWSLVDIPVALKSLAEGQFSDMVTPRGKPGPEVPFLVKNGTEHQLRHGLNDYTGWFATDADMAGNYYGYDGPCPPWNDERIHHYIFRLYALDIPRLPLEGTFTGKEARLAIRGHILDEAQIVGVYSLNPAVAPTLTR